MIIYQSVVAGDTKYIVPITNTSLVVFDIHNDSPYNVSVSFGQDTGFIGADYYLSPHNLLLGIDVKKQSKFSVGGSRYTGYIYIYTQTPIGGASVTANAPAQAITIIGYQSGQSPVSTVSLSRMQNVGNSIPLSNSVTNIQNDGNAANTPVVEATVTGSSGSNVLIDNSGNITIAEYVASVRTVLAQIISGTGITLGSVSPNRPVTINGLFINSGLTLNSGKIFGGGGWTWFDFSGTSLVITPNGGNVTINGALSTGNISGSGTITTTGDATFNNASVNGNLAMYGGKVFGSGGWVYLDYSSGKFIVTPNGSTFKIQSASLEFQDGSLLNQFHGFSGTGSGTFAHNCSRTPNVVLLQTHAVGSQTLGYDSENSTTVHVTTGAGLSWVGVAMYLG